MMQTCSNCAFRYRKPTYLDKPGMYPGEAVCVPTGGGWHVCFGTGEDCEPKKTCDKWQPSETELIKMVATLEAQAADMAARAEKAEAERVEVVDFWEAYDKINDMLRDTKQDTVVAMCECIFEYLKANRMIKEAE